MSKLTLEAYEAMADEGKNAAVARALRWVPCKCALCEKESHILWNRVGPPWQAHCNLPPYVTAGDSDPFAGWQWLAEMVKALCAHVHGAANKPVRLVCWPNGLAAIEVGWSSEDRVAGDTTHRAAGEAMAAAGLLEEPTDG